MYVQEKFSGNQNQEKFPPMWDLHLFSTSVAPIFLTISMLYYARLHNWKNIIYVDEQLTDIQTTDFNKFFILLGCYAAYVCELFTDVSW